MMVKASPFFYALAVVLNQPILADPFSTTTNPVSTAKAADAGSGADTISREPHGDMLKYQLEWRFS